MSVLHVTKDTFQSLVLENEKPVLLDFWATWCGPCRMITPTLEQLAQEYPQYAVAKVNVDEEPELTRQFGIVSIPTLFVVKGGQVTEKSVGALSLEEMLKLLA